MPPSLTRKPFSEINAYVYPKLSSPELFDCGSINLLKVVQHGLVYSFINARSKLMRSYWLLPYWMINIIFLLRRLKFRKQVQQQRKVFDRITARPYLTMDINRPLTEINQPATSKPGKPASKFMVNIFSALGRKNCFNIVNSRPGELMKVDYDLYYTEINLYLETLPLNKSDKAMLSDMKKMWKKIIFSKRFLPGELNYIKSQLHWFWLNYRVFEAIVTKVRPQQCFLIPHYHREPLIASLKLHDIPVTELQHASILQDALYYMYPPTVKAVAGKALFADRILVWGTFWKERLLQGSEYAAEKINVVGNYIYSREIAKEETERFRKEHGLNGKKIILVTSQKMLTDWFAKYIGFLAADLTKNHPGWQIILKPHPGETNLELYQMSFNNYFVTPKEVPVNLLFQIADIHVSIYSTTLYDAQAFPLVNFAITDAGISSDYALKMVQEGIALPLKMDENPVDKLNLVESSSSPSGNKYFENFQPENLHL